MPKLCDSENSSVLTDEFRGSSGSARGELTFFRGDIILREKISPKRGKRALRALRRMSK